GRRLRFAKGADCRREGLFDQAPVAATAARSQQAALGERRRRAAPDDEVVEHLHVHQRQGALQRLRKRLLGLAWLGHPGRMVARQSHPLVGRHVSSGKFSLYRSARNVPRSSCAERASTRPPSRRTSYTPRVTSNPRRRRVCCEKTRRRGPCVAGLLLLLL